MIFVYNQLRDFLREMPWILWLGMIITILALVYFLLTKSTIKRLDDIRQAIAQIRKGEYRVLLPNDKKDSLGVLENDINAMAMEIEDSFMTRKEIEQSKDDFIVNIAHDLRTPLTSIIGYLAFLTERELDTEISAKYAAVAYEKSKQLENLVESLFEVAHLTLDTVTVKREEINLKKFLMQKQDEMFPQLHSAEMEVCLDIPAAMHSIHVDGDLMARVFDNLIINAIRYAKEGKIIDIQAAEDEDDVKISFITHANPIPTPDLEHIFNKLYRVEKSRAIQTGGTGLGLSISRRIVELHGGTLTARQTEDGTAFDICLPIIDK